MSEANTSTAARPDPGRTGHDALPEIALDWHRSGRGAALATVVQTWGSAPRPVGSQLVVSAAGEMMGSVSGGCVEGAVVLEAQAALADGQPRLLTYGVTNETAFAVGLACGGTIRILVEPVGAGAGLSESVLADLVAARAAQRPVALVTRLGDWSRRLVARDAADDALRARFRADQSGLTAEPEAAASEFVAVHNPPLRLIVVGAVHIAQPLVAMARLCGYAPVLVDPRAAFGAEHRFPGETVLEDWPDEAISALAPDARTAVVTLTHDPKLDDPAIRATLASDAFYLGCLGSRRTHAARLDRLREAGVAEADIARIHAPVGLDIGARSPAEIAVSVLAEITRVLRSG